MVNYLFKKYNKMIYFLSFLIFSNNPISTNNQISIINKKNNFMQLIQQNNSEFFLNYLTICKIEYSKISRANFLINSFIILIRQFIYIIKNTINYFTSNSFICLSEELS